MIKSFFMSIILAISTFALSFSDVSNSIDMKAAKDSIKKEEAAKALKKGKDITLDDVKKSVDTKKAKESIKQEEIKKLFKF